MMLVAMDDTRTDRPALPRRLVDVLPSLAGWAIGATLGAAGRLRRGKPLHPRGALHAATLTVWGTRRPWAVPLINEPGERGCIVRVSRAIGLPEALPDIHGVAVRLGRLPEAADLLFATTGSGRVSRYVLLLRRSGRAGMTTLMPVRTATGALQLRLEPERPSTGDVQSWVVSAATPGSGRWEPFGRLVAETQPLAPDPDPPVRFDPIRNLPRGVSHYRWLRLLRDPAYVLARRWSPPSRWRTPRHAGAATPVDTRHSE